MGQDNEFNVRYLRGKGLQIVPLSLRTDRMIWAATGFVMGVSGSNVLYRFLPHDRALLWGFMLVLLAVVYQWLHLWEQHQRFKAMLQDMDMTEKQMLAKLDEAILQGREQLEALRREGERHKPEDEPPAP